MSKYFNFSQNLDVFFTILVSEIYRIREYLGIDDVFLYEVGAGTGYLLYRLKFISNFSGSAGFAIILKKKN